VINRVARIDDRVAVSNVLVSVADKRNLDLLVPSLVGLNENVRFFSTGGTHGRLAELLGESAGRNLIKVSDFTGQPEMQGGLVKTLDFKIYLGLLSESYNPDHQQDLRRSGAVPFDMVVVNLYPFEQTIAREGVTCEDARAHIDIGGPCMLRAAAKNFIRVAAVCDPDDYESVLTELVANGGSISLRRRFALAQKAFKHSAAYDSAIAGYLAGLTPEEVAGSYELDRE